MVPCMGFAGLFGDEQMDLNRRILTVEAVREADQRAIEELGIPGALLMERAGAAVAEVCFRVLGSLGRHGTPVERVLLLCGKGNNGGDGFVVARLLQEADIAVEVWFTGDLNEVDPASDPGVHLKLAQMAGVNVQEAGSIDEWLKGRPAPPEEFLVVDALLGTGARGEVREPAKKLIEWVNAGEAAVVAVDVPSGLDANEGKVLGIAMRAAWTVTFGAAKAGFFAGEGPTCVGELTVDTIGFPEWLLDEVGGA